MAVTHDRGISDSNAFILNRYGTCFRVHSCMDYIQFVNEPPITLPLNSLCERLGFIPVGKDSQRLIAHLRKYWNLINV
ncbi:hypothetical protein Y032_0015g2872 [Ancylostoma ceylanicum]|uniref:Uncharacterized protein n=1 Tax=Ancylostoma ceylanicum TaxID=53326 RepID=A0A016VA05_9BILA|nr:hypothetical protein Y032_0015g2872 [Ancylostoma ceylanicum]